MGWFKRRKNNKVVVTLQGLTGTATRAMYDTVSGSKMPVIVSYFELRTPGRDPKDGEQFTRVEVEMDLYEANAYASQLMAAIDAAMPRRARGRIDVPWSGGTGN
jgi:hypothetical protein